LKITSPYVQVSPGNTYTVSCWIAADPPRQVTVGLGSGYFRDGRKTNKHFSASKRWRKISFSAILPPSPDDRYYFVLQTDGKGRLFLDAIALRAGNSSEYIPASKAEVGFSRQKSKKLFFKAENITLNFRAINYSKEKAELKIWSTDFWGETDLLATTSLEGGKGRDLPIHFPSGRTGYYLLRAEVDLNGSLQDASEIAIGIVPPIRLRPALHSPFGGHVRFNDEMLEYAKMLGVKWLRMHPPHGTKWFIVEKERGMFAFDDAPIRLAKKKGFHILGILASSPRWASSAPRDNSSESVGGFRSYPPSNLLDWHNYVFQTVKHFRGIIDHWEVWNEPDTDFFRISGTMEILSKKAVVYKGLLESAYIAAREANPHAVIVGGCASHEPLLSWSEKIFRQGAFPYLDVLSFHRYTDGRPGDTLPTATRSYIEDLSTLTKKYGGRAEKPIWETESGVMYPETNYQNIKEIVSGYALPADEGPAFLVRNYIHLLSSGVEKWFYYHMFVSRQSDRREGTGFFEWDGSPRPLAVAYAVLSNIIDGCVFTKSIQNDDGVAGAVFENDFKRVTLLWRKGAFSLPTLNFPLKFKNKMKLVDIMGNERNPIKQDGQLLIPLSKNPVYLIERK
jgi:hypothetical protein